METNKAEEYACKKYNVKDGLNDYDENYFNSTNVNLAKAFIEGAEYRQSEIDELTKEVERLRKENEFKENQLGQIHDIVDKQNFAIDSREFDIWQIINQEPPINQ